MARTIVDDEPIDTSSPWASTANRFPEDSVLRAANFRIHRRPARQEPTWTRAGQVYGHREAVALVRLQMQQRSRE